MKKKGSRFFLRIVIFFVLVYLLWHFGYIQKIFSSRNNLKEITIEKIKKLNSFIKEKGTKTIEIGIKNSLIYARKKTGTSINNLGTNLESFGTYIVGENNNTSTISSQIKEGDKLSSFPTYSLSQKKNLPVYFSFNKVGNYLIDWGDGTSEKKEVLKETIFNHSWKKAGDYLILFEMQTSGNINEKSIFPIRIYD